MTVSTQTLKHSPLTVTHCKHTASISEVNLGTECSKQQKIYFEPPNTAFINFVHFTCDRQEFKRMRHF